jgi:hypothetical protein
MFNRNYYLHEKYAHRLKSQKHKKQQLNNTHYCWTPLITILHQHKQLNLLFFFIILFFNEIKYYICFVNITIFILKIILLIDET